MNLQAGIISKKIVDGLWGVLLHQDKHCSRKFRRIRDYFLSWFEGLVQQRNRLPVGIDAQNSNPMQFLVYQHYLGKMSAHQNEIVNFPLF